MENSKKKKGLIAGLIVLVIAIIIIILLALFTNKQDPTAYDTNFEEIRSLQQQSKFENYDVMQIMHYVMLEEELPESDSEEALIADEAYSHYLAGEVSTININKLTDYGYDYINDKEITVKDAFGVDYSAYDNCTDVILAIAENAGFDLDFDNAYVDENSRDSDLYPFTDYFLKGDNTIYDDMVAQVPNGAEITTSYASMEIVKDGWSDEDGDTVLEPKIASFSVKILYDLDGKSYYFTDTYRFSYTALGKEAADYNTYFISMSESFLSHLHDEAGSPSVDIISSLEAYYTDPESAAGCACGCGNSDDSCCGGEDPDDEDCVEDYSIICEEGDECSDCDDEEGCSCADLGGCVDDDEDGYCDNCGMKM